jgi:hypothetical protein
MITKNIGKKLFAVYKNDIHKGNSYGIDKLDAIKTHLTMANFPISNKYVNEYNAIEAKENIHYFKSSSIIMS